MALSDRKQKRFNEFIIFFHQFLQVLNSIDAQAKNIAVRVDLDLYKAEIIDNGIGKNTAG